MSARITIEVADVEAESALMSALSDRGLGPWAEERRDGFWSDRTAGGASRRSVTVIVEAVTPALTEALAELGHPLTHPSVAVTPEAEVDWDLAWRRRHRARRIGPRLVVHPTWSTPDLGPDDVALAVDPGCAFGTGSHPTTELCLVALQRLDLDGTSILDVGCGSGILAVAALRLGARNAVALDVESEARASTIALAKAHGVADRIAVDATLEAIPDEEFDVLFANIHADAVTEMAGALVARCASDGCAIVSGIREDETDVVTSAWRCHGWHVDDVASKGGFVAFCGRRHHRA